MDEMIYCLDFFQTYPEKEVGGYIHKENKIGYGLINVEYGWQFMRGYYNILSLFFFLEIFNSKNVCRKYAWSFKVSSGYLYATFWSRPLVFSLSVNMCLLKSYYIPSIVLTWFNLNEYVNNNKINMRDCLWWMLFIQKSEINIMLGNTN